MQKTNNKPVIIAAILLVVAAVVVLLFSLGVFSSTSIDDFPEEGIGIDITTQANIINADVLLQELGSVASLDNLSKDIYMFGKTAYEPYANKETDLIGFEVLSTEKIDNNVTVKGRYGSSKNGIEVTIIPLKNNRATVSITDTKTGLNIDEQLPSNSQLNQFVGQLPIETTGYVIDYLEESGDFTVNVFNNAANYAEAEAVIISALSETPPTEISIIRYGAGDIQIDNGF